MTGAQPSRVSPLRLGAIRMANRILHKRFHLMTLGGRRRSYRRLCGAAALAALSACAETNVLPPGQSNDLRALLAVHQVNQSRWRLDDLVLRSFGSEVAELEFRGALLAESKGAQGDHLLPLAFVREQPTSVDVVAADGRDVDLVSYKIRDASWLLLGVIRPSLDANGVQARRDSLNLKIRLYYRGARDLDPLLPAVPTGDVASGLRVRVFRSGTTFEQTAVVRLRWLDGQRFVPLTVPITMAAASAGEVNGQTQAVPSGVLMLSASGLTTERLWPATSYLVASFALVTVLVVLPLQFGLSLFLGYRSFRAGRARELEMVGDDPLAVYLGQALRGPRVLVVLLAWVLMFALAATVFAMRTLHAAAIPRTGISPAAMLTDLHLELDASGEALENDKLHLSWRFRAASLAGDSSMIGLRIVSEKARIDAGEGYFGGKSAEMKLFRLPGRGYALRAQIAARTIPIASALAVLRNPMFRTSQVVLHAAHAWAFDSVSVVGLSAYLSNLVVKKDVWPWRFVHRFPFDGYSLTLPLAFESAAILDGIFVGAPPSFEMRISTGSLPYVFAREGNGYASRLEKADPGGADSVRVTVGPGDPITLGIDFRRPFVQRWGLMVIPVIVAVLAGTWIGHRTLRKRSVALALIVPVSGAASSVGLLRATVLGHYPKLPQLVPLEGITTFELGVIASWLVMGMLIAATSRRI